MFADVFLLVFYRYLSSDGLLCTHAAPKQGRSRTVRFDTHRPCGTQENTSWMHTEKGRSRVLLSCSGTKKSCSAHVSKHSCISRSPLSWISRSPCARSSLSCFEVEIERAILVLCLINILCQRACWIFFSKSLLHL